MKNYGFDPEKLVIADDEYLFGALPFEILKTDGQWLTPIYEPQAEKYETFGCTVWGTQNAIESIFKTIYNVEPNYNEAFTYILAGVTLNGASPQNACEAIRKNGLINNDNLPMPDTYEEFSDPKQITPELLAKGKQWLTEYDFKHEWITSPTQEDIKDMLKYSPIGIGVTAWFKGDNDWYYSRGIKNNHWVIAFGTTEEGNIKIFDSYDSSVKILAPDHQISVGKRYVLKKKVDLELEDMYRSNSWIAGFGKVFWVFIKSLKWW